MVSVALGVTTVAVWIAAVLVAWPPYGSVIGFVGGIVGGSIGCSGLIDCSSVSRLSFDGDIGGSVSGGIRDSVGVFIDRVGVCSGSFGGSVSGDVGGAVGALWVRMGINSWQTYFFR